MTEETKLTSNSTASGGGSNNRMLIIGGIAALGLVAIIIVGGIFLLPRLFGADESAIAGVMPPETSMLVELNALNLANDETNRIARAFEDVFNEADVEFDAEDPGSGLESLDDQLEEATGLTVTDDILPWIGPNLGLGLVELDIEAMNEGEPPQIIFAATIRDTAVADVFIEDLIDAIEDDTGNRVEEVEYGGALVFEVDSDLKRSGLLSAVPAKFSSWPPTSTSWKTPLMPNRAKTWAMWLNTKTPSPNCLPIGP
jgi:hypothetical protein